MAEGDDLSPTRDARDQELGQVGPDLPHLDSDLFTLGVSDDNNTK